MNSTDFLAGATVSEQVFGLRPDYRVLLIAVEGLTPMASDQTSADLLRRAEAAAESVLAESPVDQVPHVAAWREAYRQFGAKPQRTRNSLEALMRRAEAGLPRVNRLTDVYNAISVLHQVPVGGEDLSRYAGSPKLVRAAGDESFDTTSSGEPTVEHPEPGEVVWRDEDGVTCRRWNWRQARRTALRDETTSALFIFDALAPMSDAALMAAADDLMAQLVSPGVTSARRLIGPPA